jgi:integral membrane protein
MVPMPLGPRPSDIPRLRLAVKIYKVSSIITGTMLLLLGVVTAIRWGWGYDVYAGGPRGFFLAAPHSPGGTDLTTIILIAHGWFYVLYVGLDFVLWRFSRFSFGRFLFIAAGGVIPLLSFFLERRVPRQIEAIIEKAEAEHSARTGASDSTGSADNTGSSDNTVETNA